MDEQITEWGQLWRQQASNDFDIEHLINKLKKMNRYALIQKIFFFIVVIFALYSMFTHLTLNVQQILAISVFAIGSLAVIIPLFRIKINFKNKNTQTFIESNIDCLKRKLKIPKVHFLIFIICSVLAINIGGFNQFESNLFQIVFHISTLIILAILWYARKVGIKNYESEILPVIEKLERMKDE